MPIDARSSSSSQSHATFSWFLLISANILWATSYVAGKLALSGGTSVILMLALRMSISILILLPLLIAKRKKIKAYLARFQGLSKVDASVAASTLFKQPLPGTLLAAIILLHDQLTSMTFVGGLLIILSVYVISKV